MLCLCKHPACSSPDCRKVMLRVHSIVISVGESSSSWPSLELLAFSQVKRPLSCQTYLDKAKRDQLRIFVPFTHRKDFVSLLSVTLYNSCYIWDTLTSAPWRLRAHSIRCMVTVLEGICPASSWATHTHSSGFTAWIRWHHYYCGDYQWFMNVNIMCTSPLGGFVVLTSPMLCSMQFRRWPHLPYGDTEQVWLPG